VRAIHLAYRDYLAMPHALAVAVSSQFVAFLATVALGLGIVRFLAGR
jgi:hypothetical protein